MKRGGRSLITWFLVNGESKRLIAANRSSLNFSHNSDDYYTIDVAVPELAIAFDETDALALYESLGLRIEGSIHPGSWCGRTHFLSYQDIVIAVKI